MIIGIVILYTLKLQDTIDTIEGTLVSDCVESLLAYSTMCVTFANSATSYGHNVPVWQRATSCDVFGSHNEFSEPGGISSGSGRISSAFPSQLAYHGSI